MTRKNKRHCHVVPFVAALALLLAACSSPTPATARISDPDPNPLNLSAPAGATASGTFTFRNTGDAALSFNVTDDQDWLEVSPASGSVAPGAGQTLSVSATCPSTPGNLSGAVTISSNDPDKAVKSIAVTLACSDTPAVSWQVAPASLNFYGAPGGSAPADQNFILTNTGNSSGGYSISVSGDWLSASPSEGTLAATANETVTLSVAACSADGSDSAALTVSGDGASATIGVTRSCSATPQAVMSAPNPNPLVLTAQLGQTTTGTVSFENVGTAELTFDVTSNQPWLEVSPTSGSASPGSSRSLDVNATCPGTSGDLSGTITLSSDDPAGPKTLEVTLSCSDEATEIPATTKIPDAASRGLLLSYAPEDGTLVFSESNAFLAALAPGDVLVSEPADAAPEGFLRKVTAVRSEGSKVVVETEQASLIDAIDSGSIEEQRPLTPDDLQSSQIHVPGVSLEASGELGTQASGFRYDFNRAIFDADGNSNTINDQLVVSGFLDIQPILDFKLDIKKKWGFPTGVKEFRAAVGITESSELRVVGNYDRVGAITKEFSLATLTFSSITFWIGPVPVVITPELELSIKLDGRVTATLRMRVSHDFKAQVGAQYVDGSWKNLSALDNKSNWDKPEFGATLKARGYAAARFGLRIYGVGGSYIRASPYGELDVDIRRNPHWILRGGITGEIGIYAKILSWKLADYSAKVIDRSWELGRGSGPKMSNPTPNPLNLSAQVSQSASGTVTFRNEGGTALSFTVSDNRDWLAVSPASGSVAPGASRSLSVSATCPNTAGSHEGTITLASNDPAAPVKTAAVNLTCASPAPGGPKLSDPTPNPLVLSAEVGQSASGAVIFGNTGGIALSFSVTDDQDWLEVSPSSGSVAPGASQTLSVSAQCPSTAGSLAGVITLASDDPAAAVKNIAVNLACNGAPSANWQVEPDSLSFAGTVGGGVPAEQSFTLTNTGNSSGGYSISTNRDWLSISPTEGTLAAGANETVNVSAAPCNASGSDSATVTVSGEGASATLSVTRTCSDSSHPVISDPNPKRLELTAQVGESASATVSFGNVGTADLTFGVSADADWLGVNPTSGTVSPSGRQTLEVTASCSSPAGNVAGSYEGVITISSNGGDKTVAVSLTCSEPTPDITDPEPNPLVLTAEIHQSASADLSFANVGSARVSFTATEDYDWLEVSPTSGSVAAGASQTLGVRATCPGTPGSDEGTITLEFGHPAAPVKTVLVKLTCEAPVVL